MPRGDWSELVHFVRWLAVRDSVGRNLGLLAAGLIILGASAYGYHEFTEATEDPYAAERYQPARDARLPPAPAKQQAQARPYEPNCQQPQNHADADLCAQWGGVKAVTETNRLTRLALNLAALGFIFAVTGAFVGVVGTYYLVQAFREAKRSADAAITANRPWLRGELRADPPMWIRDGTFSLNVTVTLKNFGNSPAVLKPDIDVDSVVSPMPYNRLWAAEAAWEKINDRRWCGPLSTVTIFPGEKHEEKFGIESRIEAAPVPYGLEVVPPDSWPFTNDDLVAFVAVGVWYDFAGGEGRTEFVYEIKEATRHAIRRRDEGILGLQSTRTPIGDIAR